MSSSPCMSCIDAGGDHLHQKFRFGPLFRASYSSPEFDATNLGGFEFAGRTVWVLRVRV
jgi:hypothetical protein